MAHLIDLKTFTDKRGNLTVIERVIPFDIKRVFYIYGVDDSKRGGHPITKPFRLPFVLREVALFIITMVFQNMFLN